MPPKILPQLVLSVCLMGPSQRWESLKSLVSIWEGKPEKTSSMSLLGVYFEELRLVRFLHILYNLFIPITYVLMYTHLYLCTHNVLNTDKTGIHSHNDVALKSTGVTLSCVIDGYSANVTKEKVIWKSADGLIILFKSYIK